MLYFDWLREVKVRVVTGWKETKFGVLNVRNGNCILIGWKKVKESSNWLEGMRTLYFDWLRGREGADSYWLGGKRTLHFNWLRDVYRQGILHSDWQRGLKRSSNWLEIMTILHFDWLKKGFKGVSQ